jgi:uncharacterized radical SAM protein YgiQ
MPAYDIIFVLPYLFSDHPSFPEGILARCLRSEGFSVGWIETPDRRDTGSFTRLGKPRLFFGIVSGPVDSIILNYTSMRKRRREDLYQSGGNAFFEGGPRSIKNRIRPDRTVIEYSQRIRRDFKETSILIGGIEASMRRFAHYDFQQDCIRRSILLDSRADLLASGMGEKQIVRIARLAREGREIKSVALPGTVRIAREPPGAEDRVQLPSFEKIAADKTQLLSAQLALDRALLEGKCVVQPHGDRAVVQEAYQIYSRSDLETAYGLAYSRTHPGRKDFSPALRMNLFSVTSHRGCGGGCAFCSVGAHEGKKILSRSLESILHEIRGFESHREWKGIVSDVGGASAEMFGSDCDEKGCQRPSCLNPGKCPGMKSGEAYLELLRECRKVRGVRKVFVSSGLRHDLLLHNPELLEEIMVYHSGRFLRIAPEHTEDTVLSIMRKPPFETLEAFIRLFTGINKGLKRKIELAPYIILGHPGESPRDVMRLKAKIRSLGLPASGSQIFTPSPGTLSTAMYAAGRSPRGEEICVERNIGELARRKAFLTCP